MDIDSVPCQISNVQKNPLYRGLLISTETSLSSDDKWSGITQPANKALLLTQGFNLLVDTL